MKAWKSAGICFAIVAVGLCAGLAVRGAEDADLVIYNAKVLTVDKAFSIKSAVAVKDGKIIATGSNDLAKQYSAPTKLDLHGRVLMPGFTDTHVHIFGLSRRGLDLEHVTSITQLQDMLRDKAEELGPGEWITGRSWDEFKFAEKRVPHKEDLDKVTPNNPVVLVRAGGHSSVGNSAALKLAGVDKSTPDPKSGLIEHEDNGDPNGVIRERSDLYTKLVPQDKWNDLEPSFVKSLKYVESLGITSLFEASGTIDDEPADKGGGQAANGQHHLSAHAQLVRPYGRRPATHGDVHLVSGAGAIEGVSAPHGIWRRSTEDWADWRERSGWRVHGANSLGAGGLQRHARISRQRTLHGR
jgi:predicted amidohydrolase YtcJ